MVMLPPGISADDILQHTTDGVYVTDLDCRILYWNKAAERITGWTADEVVGSYCHDGILVHVDRKGSVMCHPGRCPLHRSMASGEHTQINTPLFAQCKDSSRLPVAVSTAPLKNEKGVVIGGVEVFRDESERMRNLKRAHQVQKHAMKCDLPQKGVCFEVLYRPAEVVGGDYYNVQTIPGGNYSFILGDIVGHGLAAALYTMTMHALWHEYSTLHTTPAKLFTKLNSVCEQIFLGDSFTSAFMGVIDPKTGELAYASAGHPSGIIRHIDGSLSELNSLDLPLGSFPGVNFCQAQYSLAKGEMLFLYSDGAEEPTNPQNEPFGRKRLEKLVRKADPMKTNEFLANVENELLEHVESVFLPDDLTLMAMVRNDD